MTLCLHAGANEVEYDVLRQLPSPVPTATHHPIDHYRVVDLVKHSLTFYGHEIVEQHHAITDDGMRYFGLLSLRSPYGNYTDALGLRNSADKSFPVGISFGSRVFVCDNLAFVGDQVIRRKHTQKLRFELPGLIAAVVEPLADQREAQHRTFERYKVAALTEMQADHAILNMFREDVINVQRIPEVLKQWHKPEHDWGEPTAWRLFNAATFTLNGRVAENPGITQRLHKVIDGVCTVVQ